MSRLCAEDVERLRRAIVAIEAHNAEPDAERMTLLMLGPLSGWVVKVVSYYEPDAYTRHSGGEGKTLGDAIKAAIDAWKEGRG